LDARPPVEPGRGRPAVPDRRRAHHGAPLRRPSRADRTDGRSDQPHPRSRRSRPDRADARHRELSLPVIAALCHPRRMTQRWQVGDVTVTSVVEDETHHIPPEWFFPEADASKVGKYPDLVPDYVDEQGNIALRVQALMIETGARTVLVDPCVG